MIRYLMNTTRMKSYIWTCLVVEVIEDKCFLSLLKMKWETTAGLGFVFIVLVGSVMENMESYCIGSKIWETVKGEKVGFFCPLHRHFECFLKIFSAFQSFMCAKLIIRPLANSFRAKLLIYEGVKL